ncbi:MAG: subclass B3 metallo-beta-lactamase [Myxococcota bacterium]
MRADRRALALAFTVGLSLLLACAGSMPVNVNTGNSNGNDRDEIEGTNEAVTQARAMLRGEGSQPVEPFRVIGNIYYVGAKAISSHLIETRQGLILLDTGTREMSAGILASIETLGFKPEDIKIILSSHAHWDHVEGHAAMQAATGARVFALGDDAAAISTGIDNSAADAPDWPALKVDRVLQDQDTVSLGDVTMRAHFTPGHTKGCTTWTMTIQEDGREHLVVFVGGTTINRGVRLHENVRHPGIEDDYAQTFRTLKKIQPSVYLTPHPFMHGMDEKRRRMQANSVQNPFIDPDGYQRFIRAEEGKYLAQVAEEAKEQPR